ncbi:MAG: hypothetical protein HY939_03300 [Gammaproteobacteria bacterium]|nr:hypothetical protein [Gammaproteobacteria bacterium]
MVKGRAFTAVIVVIALIMAIAVNLLPPEKLAVLVPVSRFFEVMIPILGVGALLKYLCCCRHHDDENKSCR